MTSVGFEHALQRQLAFLRSTQVGKRISIHCLLFSKTDCDFEVADIVIIETKITKKNLGYSARTNKFEILDDDNKTYFLDWESTEILFGLKYFCEILLTYTIKQHRGLFISQMQDNFVFIDTVNFELNFIFKSHLFDIIFIK